MSTQSTEGHSEVGRKVCANCRRAIGPGNEIDIDGLFYGPKCAEMITGSIPNTQHKRYDAADQDTLEDLGEDD